MVDKHFIHKCKFTDDKLYNEEKCLSVGTPLARTSIGRSVIPNQPTIAQVISTAPITSTVTTSPINMQNNCKIVYNRSNANAHAQIPVISPPRTVTVKSMQGQRTLNIGGKTYNIKSVISPTQQQVITSNAPVQKLSNVATISSDKNVYYIKG